MLYVLYALLAIGGLLVLFLLFVALKSGDFRIARSATIAAPPAAVFPHVVDFRNWRAWSPWEDIDPDLKRTYDGPQGAVGAVYSWTGNNQVGAGRMEIVESRPGELIRIKLEFLKPFKATNATEFTFTPQGNTTVVDWSNTGTNNFICKLFSMLMNMDKIVGGQFEKGLVKLKALVEGGKA
jgi:uncharacterized protein YndB with AHSA1/START domain